MAATRGRGSKIRVKTTAGVYVDIPGLGNITKVPPKLGFIPTTDQDTPVGEVREIPGDRDTGSVTADVNFDIQEQAHLLLMNAQNSETLLDFEIKIAGPGNKKQAFQAYVASFDHTMPVNGVQTASLELRVYGRFGDPQADV